LYLGGLAIETILGVDMMYAIIGLALLQQLIHCMADYLLWLGLMLFLIFLVLGGLVTTYLALNTVSDGAGMWEGMKTVYNAAPDRFVMILDESNPEYMNLPG
jgi:SSS family solute:Na+ symporter